MKEMLEKTKGTQSKNFLLAFIIDGDFDKVSGILSQMDTLPSSSESTEWLAVNSRLFNFNLHPLTCQTRE
jgi:hypothetical protein